MVKNVIRSNSEQATAAVVTLRVEMERIEQAYSDGIFSHRERVMKHMDAMEDAMKAMIPTAHIRFT